jgi:hypothetical protein
VAPVRGPDSLGRGEFRPVNAGREAGANPLERCVCGQYMAESASNYLKENQDSRLIVLAGAAHVEMRYGVPDRITRYKPLQCPVSFAIPPHCVAH